MTWFQVWTVCWQVAIVVTPLLITTCFLWLRSQFPTKVEFAAAQARSDADRGDIRNRLDTAVARLDDHRNDHESRLKMVEADVARPPSRHALNNAISTMQGGLHAVERTMDALHRQIEAQGAETRRQMETLNGYLHTVIDKHIA